ncbi:sugar ABC transporter ATP-binding protein [Mycobacterium sp. 21AC1]|uniref:sugar ABC transporter ATP-binding protein n=1 Tax=[Mycobacterium] appelbergii TaxID=2939269 RepID=UPI002938FC23|nr:sugar ABC transporter ATP-binding protein [Mycobacterium sp. 21AC1]MDV3128004.1 sugar ABC transporter ATP-binding protein [Mycobacterium sp. 21AC1]
MSNDTRLTLSGVAKSYAAVRAIRHADFELQPGSVHALVGENGAGKSTLIKIISGAVTPDTGSITYDGRPVSIASTVDAIELGIATVYQEPQLFAELTVAENIFLGREIVKRRRVDWAAQNERVVGLLDMLGLPEKLATVPVGNLSVATQQQVSIAKALAGKCGVLILDEPSAILTDTEIEVLFGIIRRLAAEGVAVVYISHRLDEVIKIADQVTVMRDGSTIGTYPVGELSVRRMAELMVGEALSDDRSVRVVPDGPPVLELKSLARAGHFEDVSLQLRSGEILGLYGLVGSGVAEIAECIHGLARPSGGQIVLEGQSVAPRTPRQAQDAGIALLPANRKTEGMFSFQSIAFNISIAHLPRLALGRMFVDRGKERTVARDLMKRLAVRAPDENYAIGNLSGGNAQKVVLARQLVERPKLLLLAEPTQGVDVGAKEEIHRIITDLADNGTAVLVVTSDLQEALRIADRLLVIRAGTVVAEFGPDARQVDVLAAAAGDRGEAASA